MVLGDDVNIMKLEISEIIKKNIKIKGYHVWLDWNDNI
jgi:hypothetical protein